MVKAEAKEIRQAMCKYTSPRLLQDERKLRFVENVSNYEMHYLYCVASMNVLQWETTVSLALSLSSAASIESYGIRATSSRCSNIVKVVLNGA